MPDRIAEHYERHAHAFDEARRKKFVERGWLDRFLLAIPKGGHILDLGCGAGEPMDRYLIDKGCQLTGVDVSPRMITLSRTRFGRHRWVCDDMRRFKPDQSFHGVIAWDSFFHLRREEQAAMIVRAANWLAPGGGLLFNSAPARSEVISQQLGEQLYHASLSPSDHRLLFDELGLLEVAYAPDDRLTGGRSVWLVRKRH
jgi:cyclopropane fatty-acyl-phospholipid synthase-like methyltransferase